jgi:hypothetical protein
MWTFSQTPFVNYCFLKWFLLTAKDDTKTDAPSPKADLTVLTQISSYRTPRGSAGCRSGWHQKNLLVLSSLKDPRATALGSVIFVPESQLPLSVLRGFWL